MATSGSSDYTRTRNNLLTAALRIVGAAASGETPSPTEISEANDALNDILKAWTADGLHLWKRTEISNTLIVGQANYTIGTNGQINTTRPTEIVTAWRRDTSNIDRELTRISIQEYDRLPNKNTSNGAVIQYAYEPTRSNAKIYVWPPESTANCSIRMRVVLPIEDTDAVSDDVDIPQEWFLALKWSLAAEIGPEYERDLQLLAFWKVRAEEERQKVLDFDREQASVFFTPTRRW